MDSPRSWGECSDEVRLVVWNQWHFWRLARVFPVDLLLLWGGGFRTRTKTRGLGRLTRRQMTACEDHLKSFIPLSVLERLHGFAQVCSPCSCTAGPSNNSMRHNIAVIPLQLPFLHFILVDRWQLVKPDCSIVMSRMTCRVPDRSSPPILRLAGRR